MARTAKKKSTGNTRKRIKVGKLDQGTKKIGAKDMKKVKGGSYNLQQIQQTLNRVNETVTNLTRSQSDAEKSITRNLSV
jgi:hypothetical protein